MRHTLIVGPRQVGKTTLISRVLAQIGCPVWGVESKKEDHLATAALGSPIYLYAAGSPHCQTPESLAGYCNNHCFTTIKETFDRYAIHLSAPVPDGHLVLLDELGFMESSSEAFCQAVLRLLDGDVPILAAVKNKNTPFLEKVRAHPKAKCFFITEENRDTLYPEVLTFAGQQLEQQEKEAICQERP